MKRQTLNKAWHSQSNATDHSNSSIFRFVGSGSFLLDQVLGGGWAQGRVINVVGDRSSGKTLLAIEACANFASVSDPELVRYAEAESAMNDTYAAALGMPLGIQRTRDNEIQTIQQWVDDLLKFAKALKGRQPALYVLDSLDALSDDEEMERDLGKGAGYGTARAKLLSEFFRKHVNLLAEKNCTLLVVSQVRDNIGAMFGERSKRSGGRALDFYCSQIIWLYEKGKITKTVLGEKRALGISIVARNKKNKVGMPFREAEMQLMFNYGIDDETSMLDWLYDHKAMNILQWDGDPVKWLIGMRKQKDRRGLAELNQALREAVAKHWERIEEAIRPPMSKYGEYDDDDADTGAHSSRVGEGRIQRRALSAR